MIETTDKSALFAREVLFLSRLGLDVIHQDHSRPWGGFFVLDETQAQQFANHYFNGLSVYSLRLGGPLSPKMLFVAPQQRLSWQYHHRRAEIWQVVQGPVGVATSATDVEGKVKIYMSGERIVLKQGERHRLVGLDDWGVVAEIWQHTDANQPSDENDIVRVQDDFGR
jgi:mannose-6-phosphate isomerase-like protein (cupin superfamily)